LEEAATASVASGSEQAGASAAEDLPAAPVVLTADALLRTSGYPPDAMFKGGSCVSHPAFVQHMESISFVKSVDPAFEDTEFALTSVAVCDQAKFMFL
jgi:hypothetical protein